VRGNLAFESLTASQHRRFPFYGAFLLGQITQFIALTVNLAELDELA
jgi:hypothetical protein